MSMSENLMNTIRALPVADKQALLDLLTADLNRETRGDDIITQPHEQNSMDKETARNTDADRVLGM